MSRYLRLQDFVWLVLFAAIAVFSPVHDPVVIACLIAIGIVQVLESRIGPKFAIVFNLALCYPLMYFSQPFPIEINSSYWYLLFLPVVSAASTFDFLGSALVAIIAAAENASLLVWVWEYNRISPDAPVIFDRDNQLELVLRLLSLFLVSYATHQLARAKREEAAKYQRAAEQLAAANRSLKEAEQQVRRSERLAALGQLTAGLAHELRNPMGTMKTSAELLARSVEKENEIAREMAAFIKDEVDRTNSLITRFLDFAKPLSLKPQPVDLAAMLDHVVQRFERENRWNISVYKNYSPDIPPVPMDAELMERVILNLMTNAAQASPPSGAITVKTRLAGGMAEIAVIDRGSGIDPRNLESIFNPFFTTKSDGVGLGLAICSKIVDEHGGQIKVESAPGEGSVFHVFLPVRRQ
ncbi:MAG TPA: ATP-binding protein [Bryobacteraceae bacterium]|jgi:two-component system sensor histidine kinase HydH|nr:ATP-binding protein [Bryobacteraceae bacterium]